MGSNHSSSTTAPDQGQSLSNKTLFEYAPLNHEDEEQRFLTLFPYDPRFGDNDAHENHVRGKLEALPFAQAPPFIAVKNARGFRLLRLPIEVNGKTLSVSAGVETFLRHFRKQIDKPTTLWIRHVCLNEPNQDEQSRYWSREWSDKMYGLGTETIDMHEFNSALIDAGKAKNVVDSAHVNAKKLWHDVPKTVIAPKVFPIRLGQKPNLEHPTDDLVYVPLDPVTDEIRVFLLAGSPDPDAPVILHLGHCPIYSEVTYIALSYQPGPPEEPLVDVVCTGQRLQIRSSLLETLRAHRSPDSDMILWVDAISINQSDVSEKNRQLARKGEIIYNAAVVGCYTGPPPDDHDMVVELAQELNKHPAMRMNSDGIWILNQGKGFDLEKSPNHIEPSRLPRMAAALYKYLSRQYFRRAWVLQEIALASNPMVDKELSFRQIEKAAYNFSDMLTTDLSLPFQIENADSSVGQVNVDMLAFPRILYYLRHLFQGGDWSYILPTRPIKETSPSFLESLILTRNFEASDLRDKVYSLWNVAKDKQGLEFEIDYAKSPAETYLTFASAWARQHQSLDILGAAEPHRSTSLQSLPSWCPDWSTSSTSSCMVRHEHIPLRMLPVIDDLEGQLYSADGHEAPETYDPPLFTIEAETLHCTGVIVDEISFFFDDAPEIPDGMLFPRGCDPISYHKFHHWRQKIESHYASNPSSLYEDPGLAATAMFHGDASSVWVPQPLGPELDNHPQRPFLERYVCTVKGSRYISTFAGSYSRHEAHLVVKNVLRGRRPFVSRDGRMGIAPTYVLDEESDKPLLLAILAGCSAPVLVREQDDASYRYCGTAFVQGWMDGEVLTGMLGAESTRKFWEATREKARLKIC